MRKSILIILALLILTTLIITIILISTNSQEKSKATNSNTIRSNYPSFQNNQIPATEIKTSCRCSP